MVEDVPGPVFVTPDDYWLRLQHLSGANEEDRELILMAERHGGFVWGDPDLWLEQEYL